MNDPDAPQFPLRGEAIRLIAEAFTTGDLRHPNKPDVAIMIPTWLQATQGSREKQDATKAAVKIIAEALVESTLAKLDATLITNTELAALREAGDTTPPNKITLTCNHGDLLHLMVLPGRRHVKIDCKRLRRNLTECD